MADRVTTQTEAGGNAFASSPLSSIQVNLDCHTIAGRKSFPHAFGTHCVIYGWKQFAYNYYRMCGGTFGSGSFSIIC